MSVIAQNDRALKRNYYITDKEKMEKITRCSMTVLNGHPLSHIIK